MFRSRITIRRVTFTQNDAGGLIPVSVLSWSKFAQVEDRSGSVGYDRSQRDWEYNYKITTRHEKSRQEQSGDIIEYGDKVLAIKELSFKNEGKRRFNIIRCSTVEGVTPVTHLLQMGIFTYTYTGTGGEKVFIAPELAGKTILAASKDGLEMSVYTLAVRPIPTGKEMAYDAFGGLQWGIEFEEGEKAIIHYT